jgi:1-deoxy-D-xylulose-5-phosphate reductoisomerase
MKRIAVLGSTGSIGTSCLDVAAAHPERIRIVGLTTHRRWQDLAGQCRQFRPELAVVADHRIAGLVDRSQFPRETEVRFGPDAVAALAGHPEVDTVISGIVGAAGLRGTWAAVEQGKTVGLANKETLVVAGPLVMDLAARTGATIVPVDSEHCAVFQGIACGRREEVRRIILTASGGPFRDWQAERLKTVTPQMALAHPTWDMGPKITIDSATMMNKALEVIEARWLFGLRVGDEGESAEEKSSPHWLASSQWHLGEGQIDVVIHPQSIVHSMVEFVDGSVMAQLSPPDMRLPIQYALTYPERWEGVSPRLNLKERLSLQFEPPDLERFPALGLGFEVARRGGTCGAVLNAANEVAVQRFLDGQIAYCDIARGCHAVLESHQFDPSPGLDRLLELDRWAREEMVRWKV